MDLSNPLRAVQEQAEAAFAPYGPPEAGIGMVQTFGAYEAEYAAIRKGAGLLDLPQRGVVEVTGGDRAAFLHRLVTNDILALQPGQGRRAFLLSATGRITADLLVLHGDARTLLDTDRLDAANLAATLEGYVFTEDVRLRDASADYHHLALHGPAAAVLLKEVGAPGLADLAVLGHRRAPVAGHECLVFRHDDTGAMGMHLLVRADDAAAVYATLAETGGGLAPEANPAAGQSQRNASERGIRGVRSFRGVGWLAYNTARIEAGTPLYHIDFGPDSLPHETGLLDQAVSFTKGCYVGQEVVARMQNLGHPRKVLVGLRCADERLPIAGAQVFEAASEPAAGSAAGGSSGGGSAGEIIGAVTSSAVSPLLGNTAIALTVMQWGRHVPGTKVAVPAEGQMVRATVQGLGFM